MGSQSSAYVGDVAPWYLNYTDAIIQWFPEAKLVCLKRDKEATCKSIIYVSDTLGSNHFVFKNSEYFDYSKYQVDSEEARQFRWCFPKYSMPLEKAVSEYYDEYYKRAEMYQQKYPNNFKIFDTETTLNTEAGQFEVLKWAGFSSSFCLLNLRIFKEFEAHRMGELK